MSLLILLILCQVRSRNQRLEIRLGFLEQPFRTTKFIIERACFAGTFQLVLFQFRSQKCLSFSLFIRLTNGPNVFLNLTSSILGSFTFTSSTTTM